MLEVSRSDLTRIVVALDPATTSNEDSDDTGIVVVARGPHIDAGPDAKEQRCSIPYCPGHGYVLDDRTCHVSPAEWAKIAVGTFDAWQADRIVAETNNGGDMVGTTIHAVRAGVPYSKVTATRGKKVRAEPASALSEQGRVHFVGEFPELEEELTTWTPDDPVSPNRLDALVWGLTFLGLCGGQGDAFLTYWQDEIATRTPNPTPPELQGLPTPSDDPSRNVLRPGCKHRWMDGRCVYCAGDKPTA